MGKKKLFDVPKLFFTDKNCFFGDAPRPGVGILLDEYGMPVYPVIDWLVGLRKLRPDPDDVSTIKQQATEIRMFWEFLSREKKDWLLVNDDFLMLWRDRMFRGIRITKAQKADARKRSKNAVVKIANRTINGRISTVVQFYLTCKARGLVDDKMIGVDGKFRINLEIKGSEGRQQWVWIGNLPHEDSASPNFINDEDVELLHDKIDELFTYQTSQRNRLYLDWNRYVGLRGLEATSLKIHMIPPLEDFQEYIDQEKPFPMDFSPKKQGVRTKGGKDRPRPLDVDPMLLKHTRDYIDFVRPEIVDRAKTKFGRLYKESDALFLSTTGDTLGQQMKTKSMQEALREAIKAAGVKMKPHDLRRLFSMSVVSRLYIGKILRLKEKGHSINTIIATIDDNTIITYASQQLGHKFSSVTIKHYLDQTKLKLLKMSDEVRLEYLERHKFSSLAAIKEHETEEETEQQMKYKEAESAGLIDALKEGNKDKVFEILQQHVLK